MRWHYDNVSDDGIIHHPINSSTWKNRDSKWPNFSNDPRNVQLATCNGSEWI